MLNKTDALRKFHNLTLNCTSPEELYEHAFLLCVQSRLPSTKRMLNNLINNATLAAECSRLPIYYFEASKTTGLKQDRKGKWY